MATESVIFTALPNGIDRSGLLKVTVFVSPRLSTDGAGSLFLSSFPAFENWPKTFARLLEEGGLVIEFEGSGPVSTDPDPELRAARPRHLGPPLRPRQGRGADRASSRTCPTAGCSPSRRPTSPTTS